MKGVMITALGKDADDNKGTLLLRLWEQAGTRSTITIQLPRGIKTSYAVPVNPRGEIIGKKIWVKDNKLVVPLQEVSPVSFILQTAE